MQRQEGGVRADKNRKQKDMWKIIVAALLLAWAPSGCAVAAKRQTEHPPRAEPAQTAFCWPLAEFRYSLNRPTGAWLAPRGRHSHHLGVDMFAPVGRPVRAVADGVVHDISTSGWGGGNVAIMVRHRLADGRWFIALYGHIRNIYGLRKGSRVQGCGTIGVIGPYRCGSHVHFGVIAPGRLPHAPYGTSKRGDHNNFINPVRFLQTGWPEKPGQEQEPPPPPEEDSAAVSPQCAGTNLAEGSPEEDELLDSVLDDGEELLAEIKEDAPKEAKTAVKKTGSKKKAVVKTKSAAKRKAVAAKKASKKTKGKRVAARSAKKSSSKKTPVLKGGSKRSVSPRKRK
jgi:hypothetical protein